MAPDRAATQSAHRAGHALARQAADFLELLVRKVCRGSRLPRSGGWRSACPSPGAKPADPAASPVAAARISILIAVSLFTSLRMASTGSSSLITSSALMPTRALDDVGVLGRLEPRGIDGVLADILVEPDPAAQARHARAAQDHQPRAHGLRAHAGEQQRVQAFLGLVGDRQEFS